MHLGDLVSGTVLITTLHNRKHLDRLLPSRKRDRLDIEHSWLGVRRAGFRLPIDAPFLRILVPPTPRTPDARLSWNRLTDSNANRAKTRRGYPGCYQDIVGLDRTSNLGGPCHTCANPWLNLVSWPGHQKGHGVRRQVDNSASGGLDRDLELIGKRL